MTGWCPVHDKVYEADDGLCPRCGTALVADEDAPEYTVVVEPEGTSAEADGAEPSRTPAPAARKRAANVVTVAAAVVVAFVAGLAFPQPKRTDDQRAKGPFEAAIDRNVGVSSRAGAVALRLESFTQRGTIVVLRLTVPPVKGLDLGRLRSVAVSFADATGTQLAVEDMTPRVTVSGFILEGSVLPRADTPVAAIGIDYLALDARGEAKASLDLRGAWPASAATQPRARAARGRLDPGEGPVYSITGVVGWADRLEVGLAWRENASGWQYGAKFRLESGNVSTAPTSLEGGPAGFVVRFTDAPRDWYRAILRMTVSGLSITGPWAWRLPPG